MTIQTVNRKCSAAVHNGGIAQEFTYKIIDVLHYVKGEDEGTKAIVEFVRVSSDIKAQAAYRRVRKGTDKTAGMDHDKACAWMLTEFECIPGTRVKSDPVEKVATSVAKLSKEEKTKLLEMLMAEAG